MLHNVLQSGFDLVCVAPNAKTPVCRFMDYSKYRYEQQKRAREEFLKRYE